MCVCVCRARARESCHRVAVHVQQQQQQSSRKIGHEPRVPSSWEAYDFGTFDWERSDDSKILFFPKSPFLFGNVPVKWPEKNRPAIFLKSTNKSTPLSRIAAVTPFAVYAFITRELT